MLYILSIFIFIFGLAIGSFLNCLIWRLHKQESMLGRSHCAKCLHKLAWYDNIPLFSFAFLLGKCRYCRKKISWQYPIVELVAGILFVAAFYFNYKMQIAVANVGQVNYEFFDFFFLIHNSSFLIQLFRDWFIISIMIIVFIYDLRWYLILDIVTLPACIIVLTFNLLLGISWQNLLISGIIGLSFFLIQFLISRGKWIGGGDIRLGLLMGLALGWPNILLAIVIAYFIGSIIGVGLILSKKKKWGSQIPLGIFLSTATVITIFWGNEIVNWYLSILF